MQTLYHGTTTERWARPSELDAPLYLVKSYKEAEVYAGEAGEADWDDEIHEDGGNVPALIVLEFSMDDLKALAATGVVVLEPDWGWVQGQEHEANRTGIEYVTPDWQESLKKVGSIAVRGFREDHKALGRVMDGLVEENSEKHDKRALRP